MPPSSSDRATGRPRGRVDIGGEAEDDSMQQRWVLALGKG